MSDDFSPGDARKPYSDIGGPAAKHAQTHDVRQEQLTNPKGPDSDPQGMSNQTREVMREKLNNPTAPPPEDPTFVEQTVPGAPGERGSQSANTDPAVADKELHDRLPKLTDDELARIPVLETGTQLEQGGVYLDLNQLDQGPFKALGSHTASASERIISKKGTDYLLWNRVAGQDARPDIERPDENQSGNG